MCLIARSIQYCSLAPRGEDCVNSTAWLRTGTGLFGSRSLNYEAVFFKLLDFSIIKQVVMRILMCFIMSVTKAFRNWHVFSIFS